jgi:hypothetical protein
MVNTEEPVPSAGQPIGLPGDWLVMNRMVPPVVTAPVVAEGEDAVGLAVVEVGAVVAGAEVEVVGLGTEVVGATEVGAVVVGAVVVGEFEEVPQPVMIKAHSNSNTTGMNNFFKLSSSYIFKRSA